MNGNSDMTAGEAAASGNRRRITELEARVKELEVFIVDMRTYFHTWTSHRLSEFEPEARIKVERARAKTKARHDKGDVE